MRTLVIGDIHGSLVALNRLLDAVYPSPKDQIITLGDYVDRGPDSRGVIDRLITLSKSHRLIPLKGNHEELMLDARQDPRELRGWCLMGGDTTLRSYAGPGVAFSLALQRVPAEHWTFLENNCRDWHESATHIFSHGYVDENVSMLEQEPVTLRWKRFIDPKPHLSGKPVICGHTAQRDGRPKHLGYATCIDTCIYAGGWLTCLEIETGRLWQANQQGQVQMANIENFRG